MNRVKFKESLIILGLMFPLTLITAFFTILTYGVPYSSPIMIIFFFILGFLYYVIVRLKLNYIRLSNNLVIDNKKKIIIFISDVVLTIILITIRNLLLSSIIILIYLILAILFSLDKPKKHHKSDKIIDLDEFGNMKEWKSNKGFLFLSQ